MADTKEALEIMREAARSRIQMLRDGTTFHDDTRRAYYLREYEAKLGEIDQLIRRINFGPAPREK